MFGGRHSKFKNIFGDPKKKEECMDQIKFKVKGSDPPLAAVNAKYLAVLINCSTVDVMIRALEEVGRVEANPKGVKSANSLVTCIEWCPRDDDVLLVGQHSGEINLVRVPHGGPGEEVVSTNEAEQLWNCEAGSILGAAWHPTVANALLTSCGNKFASVGSSQDTHLIMWDTTTTDKLLSVPLFNCYLTSMSFNFNGSRIVCTDNLHITRIIDLRSNTPVLQEAQLHKKARRNNTVYLNDGYIFSTGYSSTAKREYALWKETDLNNPVELIDLDTNSGVLYPIFDADVNVLYVWGKGDSTVSFFEFVSEPDNSACIKYLGCFSSNSPQMGVIAMPKLGVNTAINELTRLFKFYNTGFCEFIPVICPRREQGFSEDVYPPTPSRQAAISAEDWLAGVDVDPVLISLESQDSGAPVAAIAAVSHQKNPMQKLMEIKEIVSILGMADSEEAAARLVKCEAALERIREVLDLHQQQQQQQQQQANEEESRQSAAKVADRINSLQRVETERQQADKRGLLAAVDAFVPVSEEPAAGDNNGDAEWDN